MGQPICHGLRVVELADDPAGEMTGKLLAQYGADVVKVEPPGGSPTRRIGPFAGGEEDRESSLTYWYYNTNKRSVVADVAVDKDLLGRLLDQADVLVISSPLATQRSLGLDPQALAERYHRLIVCDISPFGQDGPWAEYGHSDLVALAAGGLLNSCGYDDHSIPPIRPAENQAYHVAASFALISIFLGLIERDASGRGQVVDLSVHDSVAVSPELANPYWFYPKALVQRQTCRHAQPVPTQPALFATLDGRYVYFALILADSKPWQNLVEWMDSLGIAADLTDPEYDQLAHRQANFPHIQQILEAFFLIQDAETIYHEGQSRGLPIAVINSPDDVLTDEHLAARGFFESVEHERGAALYPGPPISFSGFPTEKQTAAPACGSTEAGEVW